MSLGKPLLYSNIIQINSNELNDKIIVLSELNYINSNKFGKKKYKVQSGFQYVRQKQNRSLDQTIKFLTSDITIKSGGNFWSTTDNSRENQNIQINALVFY